MKENWAASENFSTCFYAIFNHYYESLFSGRKTNHESQSVPNIDLFVIISNFLKFMTILQSHFKLL